MPRGFWRDILAGRDLITDVPATHWLIDDYYDADPGAPDKTYAQARRVPARCAVRPARVRHPAEHPAATDTAQLLALIVAKQVLEDAAQGDFANLDRDRISVILGVTAAQELVLHMASRLQRPVWRRRCASEGLPEDDVAGGRATRIGEHYVPWQENTFPGLLGNVVAGRIANRLDLGGTNCVVDAACASSLAAMSMAVIELHLGQSDLVITGGVDTFNDIFMYMCFSKTPALSPTGDCRPFDADSDGTILGEGLGMVVLKRLADAERDGDRDLRRDPRARLVSRRARAERLRAACRGPGAGAATRLRAAGYGPDTVELVEAHGTGTKVGDAAEFEALTAVFDAHGPRGPRSGARSAR